MPITAAALAPHPPLLLPELGRGPWPDLEQLRFASRQALATLLDQVDALLIVGPAPTWGEADPGANATFLPWGAPVTAHLPDPSPGAEGDARAVAAAGQAAAPASTSGPGEWLDRGALPPGRLAELPLSLAVAAWLLDQVATERELPPVTAFGVPAGADPGEAAALGRALAAAVAPRTPPTPATPTTRATPAPPATPAAPATPVGLLVMADLSARRTQRAPAAFHPGAEEFDRRIGDAIRKAELGRLLDVDPGLASTMAAGGMAALWLLAGALESAHEPHGEVLYEGGPFGVGYLVGVIEAR